MPRDLSRDALYNGRINLWTEDDLTRAYLSALWNEPGVNFPIGGGRDGVKGMLEDAKKAGYPNVFGVVDRDFGKSNYDDWFMLNPTLRRFILPRHEMENFLLDAPSLEGCSFNTHRRVAAEIESILKAEATRRCWSSACRDVIGHIRGRFFDDFIAHPTMPPVDSHAAARDHIASSRWFQALPRRSAGMTDARLDRLLTRAYDRADRLLDSGGWRVEFSGKEIFKVVGNQIFNRATAPTYQAKGAEFDRDLAVSIAEWQVANNAVPNELDDLLRALKTRIAP